MKKINRHNYEEYFLLYVDNELSAEQRAEVEKFAEENKDIAVELAMLLDTKLPDETIYDFDKTLLLKKEGSTIDLTNIEEFFLLHIDHELNTREEAELKVFMAANPQLQQQLNVLRLAILPIENIEFKNKKILYKKESDERVVPFNWLKLAVAAAFIGLIVTAGIVFYENKTSQFAVAVLPKTSGTKDLISPEKTMVPKNDTVSVAAEIVKPLKSFTVNKSNVSTASAIVNKKQDDKIEEKKEQNDVVETPVKLNNNNNHNATQPQVTAIEKPADTAKLVAAKNNSETDDDAIEIKKEQAIYAANSNTNSNRNIVQPAVYHQLNTDDADDKSLYLGSIELNKNKVRNIFKKASRIFGSKAKDKDDGKDVKVANLDINTQNL